MWAMYLEAMYTIGYWVGYYLAVFWNSIQSMFGLGG